MSIESKYDDFLNEVLNLRECIRGELGSKEVFSKEEVCKLLTLGVSHAVLVGNEDLFREAIRELDSYVLGGLDE